MITLIQFILDRFHGQKVCSTLSTRTFRTVLKAFYFAQKILLHPTKSVHNLETCPLIPGNVAALRRNFKLWDEGPDESYNDEELNAVQFNLRNFIAMALGPLIKETKALHKNGYSNPHVFTYIPSHSKKKVDTVSKLV